MQAGGNGKKPRLQNTEIKFKPYGPSQDLVVLGRSQCTLTAGAGAEVKTCVYVVKGAKESLLGLRDGEALGIIKIKPEGEAVKLWDTGACATTAQVRRLDTFTKEAVPAPDEIVSGGQTQGQIDQSMVDL